MRDDMVNSSWIARNGSREQVGCPEHCGTIWSPRGCGSALDTRIVAGFLPTHFVARRKETLDKLKQELQITSTEPLNEAHQPSPCHMMWYEGTISNEPLARRSAVDHALPRFFRGGEWLPAAGLPPFPGLPELGCGQDTHGRGSHTHHATPSASGCLAVRQASC